MSVVRVLRQTPTSCVALVHDEDTGAYAVTKRTESGGAAEARVLRSMRDRHPHANVMAALADVGRTVRMPYMGLGDLFSFVARHPRGCRVGVCGGILTSMVSAVSHLHGVGISHNDISPENFLLTCRRGGLEVVLADFGLSSAIGAPCAPDRAHVGKSGYRAPEVECSTATVYTAAMDVFSVTVTMFCVLVGTMPFLRARRTDARFELVNDAGSAALLDVWGYGHVAGFALEVFDAGLREDPRERSELAGIATIIASACESGPGGNPQCPRSRRTGPASATTARA